MKRILTITALLFLSTGIFAQSLSGYKICIDPGHGGFDSNDRFIPTTGFWESTGNWEKTKHLKQILEDLGAEIIVTRQGNTTADDLPLSVRSAIANQNNVDFFHSIHSNGFNGGANYTLMLFNGETNNPTFAEAKQMGAIMAQELFKVNYTTDGRNAGDRTFLGFNLGVLRNLAMPGVLSEGSFHDYIPESWRLLNDYYRRHEAYAIARSFLRHFSAGSFDFGIVAGVVRDIDKTVPSSYKPISSIPGDNKVPVNFTQVRLEPGERVYTGDNKNNGYYFFDNVEPGQYTLYFESDFYSIDSSNITVAANQSRFVNKQLTEIPNLNAPIILNNFPADQSVDQSTRDTIEIVFSIRMDRNATQSAFSIAPSLQGEFVWLAADRIFGFVPSVPFEQNTQYTVAVQNTATTVYNVNLTNLYSFSFTTGEATPASVVSSTPADGSTLASNFAPFTIDFDVPMDSITTINAVTIIPDTEGDYNWENNDTRLVFNPTTPYTAGEEHTVTVSTDAKSFFGGNLTEQYSISFNTRAKLNLLSVYPANGDADISTTVLFRAAFEMPILAASLPGNVLFYDENDNFVDLRVNTDVYPLGIIEFRPRNPLENGKNYRIILKEGVADVESVPFREEQIIEFTIEKTVYTDGQIIEDFEAIGTWLQPGESDSTFGIDEEQTSFKISSSVWRNGTGAGVISYTFVDDFGRLVIENSTPVSIASSSNEFGLWVYGDISYNFLEYKFTDGSGSEFDIPIDTLNWTGWKMKSVKISDIGASSNLAFKGVTIKNNVATSNEGLVYFDDMQVDFVTPVEQVESHLPTTFALEQNYPNPFNPTTTIHYSLPAGKAATTTSGNSLLVNVKLFDILGREVATLVNTNQKPGNYKIEFDASGLPSGVYLYRMDAGQFTNVKKMVLLK